MFNPDNYFTLVESPIELVVPSVKQVFKNVKNGVQTDKLTKRYFDIFDQFLLDVFNAGLKMYASVKLKNSRISQMLAEVRESAALDTALKIHPKKDLEEFLKDTFDMWMHVNNTKVFLEGNFSKSGIELEKSTTKKLISFLTGLYLVYAPSRQFEVITEIGDDSVDDD